jgi:hypothetical protein
MVFDSYAYIHDIPCRNKTCKSYGSVHPNCRCGQSGFAEGGEVHFCSTGNIHNADCEHFADGGQVEENTKLHTQPGLSIDHAAVDQGLLGLLTKLGMQSRSPNPGKPVQDYMDSSRRGSKSAKSNLERHFDKNPEHPDPDPKEIQALSDHLESLNENPHQLLDVGGSLGNVFPDHQVELAAKAAAALNYFGAIKPKKNQPGPLDAEVPANKLHEANYVRQLAVAQNPLSILNRVKRGTVLPSDLTTLHTVYPKLATEMQHKAFASLVDAKEKDQEIPYKHKIGLSALLQQPLDSTMTTGSLQAIIKANGAGLPQQAPPKPSHKRSGATEETQKTINKVNDMAQTPLERLQTKKI